MSEPIPFLGSKISLISKSEIRYEGILYTIDPQESIIVLTKVQSFGTEDRPAELVVPSRNDIYEFIIFRGTDIKKIEVCDAKPQIPAFHNDPAIVGLQVQQHGAPIATTYPGATFSHQQPLGAIGSVGNYYSGYNPPLNAQHGLQSSGFSIGVSQPSEFNSGIGSSSVGGVSVEAHSPTGTTVGGGIDGSSGVSNSNIQQNIPAPIGAPPQSSLSTRSQPQPKLQPPQQQPQPSPPQQSQQQDVLAGSRASTPSVSRKSPVADAGVQVSSPPHLQMDKKRPLQSIQRRQQTPERQQVRENGQGGPGNLNRRNQFQNVRISGFQYGQQGPRYNQGYYQGMGSQQYQGQYRGGGGGGTGRGRAPRRSTQARGGGGGRGGYNQGNRQRQDQQIFKEEFDFEQANVEFEELRTQMANTKISNDGAVERKTDEKKDDSGHETATTGDESEDSSSSSVYYDKTKSFFDSISCEALERSKGKSQRSDWRQERKINVQTFGVATARRGYYPRGGRGGYYNRGGYYRNYNQGYYRGNPGGYRNSRSGGNGIFMGGLNSAVQNSGMNRGSYSNGTGNVNSVSGAITSNGLTTTASYASAVRNAASAPVSAN